MSRSDQRKWDLEELLSVFGFVFELLRVVVHALRKRGGTVEHLRRLLKEPPLVDKVFDLIVDKGVTPSLRVVLDLTANYEIAYEGSHRQKCRLKLVEGGREQLSQMSDLQVVSFGRPGDGIYIYGHQLRERAKSLKAELGIADLKFVLERQAQIPAEFRRNYLVFAGVTLYSRKGEVYIPYLEFRDGEWQIQFQEDKGAFTKRDRLVRSLSTI